MNNTNNNKSYYVYLVRCNDDTLYCGISNDVSYRVGQHNLGKGAKYTKSRRPVELVWLEKADNKSEALKRECVVKKMKRIQKLDLINGYGQ
jgi:putative endonuclease